MKHLHVSLCCSCCLLLISFCVTGTYSSGTLIQTSKSSISLVNDSTEMSCSMTSPLDQQGISWYRQTNGSFSVEFIASSTVLEKVNYGQGFSKERITVNRERFRNGYILKIRNLQLSDSGLYYCMTELGGKMYFGNGTMLHVVVSLPTTVKPMVKSTPCKCRRTQAPQRTVKGYYCSAVIWAPLAGCAVLLLILLCYCIYHTRRAYRRSRLFFKKMKLQK